MSAETEPKTEYDPAFVEMLLAADKAPPAAKFDNVEDMLRWLDAGFEGSDG